ncbi:MBL fold metallo-hydrolase [Natronoarchaeum rubrum]|uniref:MBL fold metallo-hydrolase n=1 Tax=Natronoarchaeum rubrum TaxID=755311 RepID=UPI0021135578|nr:MBL fold metallo-hydrolase [Natronoarchaeum rubrum]
MFSRLSIPTPFQVGPVNAYLAGRTIIDPGPDSEESWEALAAGLADHDLEPGDLDRALITHPHPDHFGAARRLREAGVEILAAPATAEIIRAFGDRLDYEQSFFEDFFVAHGMSRSTASTVVELPEAYLPYAPDCEVDATLADGDVLEIADLDVTVEAVEGHAPGELIFTYEAAGRDRAIVGDHVLGDVTPNPLLQPPAEPGGERPRMLPAYNDSLAELRDRGLDEILPGHGERIEAPGERIDEMLAAHEDRTDNVRALVEEPATAMDVMEGLFDDLPATEYFPAMSEAIGHLDVLEARGDVTPTEGDDGLVRYEATGA